MSELPKGWALTSLGNVGRWASGGTPSRRVKEYFGKGIPWVKSGDLPDGPIQHTDEEITELGLRNSSSKLMPPGTISVALYGATIGKLGVLTFPAATNQACANVIPNTDLIEPQYLFYYLMSERKNLIEKGQGGAQPNISQEILKNHPLPLAPIHEQRRIVAKLEKLLSCVDAAQARLAKIPLILKRFRQAVLAAACSGRLTNDWRLANRLRTTNDTNCSSKHDSILEHSFNDDSNFHYETPSTWTVRSLDSSCTKITDGEHLTPKLTRTGIPLLSAKDVRENFLDFSECKFVTDDVARQSRNRCDPERGDILVVSRGATIGRTSRVKVDDVFCLMGSVLLFKTNQNILHSNFLEYLFKSPFGSTQLLSRSGASAQQAIYIRDMKSFSISLPPLSEQHEIVRRVEEFFKTSDALERRYLKAKADLDKLTQSILARAFRGELVAQDPNDE